MTDRILVTGGTGKTGRRVTQDLRARGHAPRFAARSATGPEAVRFDWLDPDSYDAALRDVGAIYLVAPQNGPAMLDAMRPFLEQALGSGVRRFVLLSASSLKAGGPMMGAVHAWLQGNAPEWVVLRPSWFMQNFSEQQHLPTIRNEGAIHSATEDGRVPFIDAADIAAVASAALTDSTFTNGERILTGPRALTYDEVADIIARESGRPVAHRRLSPDDLAAYFRTASVPSDIADTLAAMDAAVATGAENRVTDVVETVTNRPPKAFEDFACEHAGLWTA